MCWMISFRFGEGRAGETKMKNYTTDAPAWSDTIPVVEQNDLVNAENDSAAAKQLLQNIMVLAATKVDKEDGKSLVSDAERNLWNMIYEQATGYTDQKIAGLINGAPSTRHPWRDSGCHGGECGRSGSIGDCDWNQGEPDRDGKPAGDETG